MSPTGPYFPTGFKPITLFAECDAVRSWPGGTGAFKLGINYTPTFQPQREAAKRGYQQILWVLGQGDDRWVTEVGQMNFFAVVDRSDGGKAASFLGPYIKPKQTIANMSSLGVYCVLFPAKALM